MTIKDKQLTDQFELPEVLLDSLPMVFCKDKNGVYRGCNVNQAKTLGFNNPSEFVGKTIFDILKDKQAAIVIDQTDKEIMRSGKPAVIEETIKTPLGTKTYLSQKQPIHCDNGSVIGMLGFAMDITEIKRKQLEAEAERERMQKEIEHYKNLAQQHSKFQQIANQVAHDIVSPLSALSTIISMLKDIPEQHRITLKQAATRIEDITNDLLKHYRTTENKHPEANKDIDIFFTYLGLRETLSEKRVEYHSLPINFSHLTGPGAHFAFIQVNSKSFRRMLSNLINNAVEALEGKAGTIQIKITVEPNNTVVLTIADTGKGMPPEVREKILGGVPVIDDKKKSHGIGMCQVRDTLQQSKATMDIETTEGAGTKIILTFPKSYAPHWATTKLTLRADQTVLILDDDPFIHGAWDARFAKILAANPEMKLMHFTNGSELLEFLEALDPTKKDKFYLLSDHELIDQELHGLNVISQSKLNNATLVTSHYTNPNVLAFANELQIPILPKRLAPKVPIQIIPLNSAEHGQTQLRKADVILIDDSQVFAESIIFRLLHRKVVHYLDPRVFLAECEEYAKDTPICVDNHFGAEIPFGGLEVAEQLHARGFTRLYIVSGAHFDESSLPTYVTLIKKLDLDLLDSL